LSTRQHFFDATFFILAETAVKKDEAFSDIAIELHLLTPSQAKVYLTSKKAVLT